MHPKLFEDDKVVVRGHWQEGKFHVYVHPKQEDKEMQPRAYWQGSNSLSYEPPKVVKR